MIIELLMIIVFAAVFAGLNRLRGGDIKVGGIKLNTVAKQLTPVLIWGFSIFAVKSFSGFLVWQSYIFLPAFWAAYRIGESFGWGKWIGAVVDGQPRLEEKEGFTFLWKKEKKEDIPSWIRWAYTYCDNVSVGFHKRITGWYIVIQDGIHFFANLIANEEKDHMKYSYVALAIRGLYWWFFTFLTMVILGMNWLVALLMLTASAITFPICYYLGNLMPGEEKDWEYGEWFYGAASGVIFWVMFIFG